MSSLFVSSRDMSSSLNRKTTSKDSLVDDLLAELDDDFAAEEDEEASEREIILLERSGNVWTDGMILISCAI